MIGVPTTFVVGAGASKPYGLPVGSKLHEEATSVTIQSDVFDLLVASGFSPNKLLGFLKDLKAHPANSIDDFLRTRQDADVVMQIGKSLIACLMGRAIQRTGRAKSGDWLGYVVDRMLADAATWEEFCYGNRVKFVTFNFDSLIEQRLSDDLRKVWANASLERIPIIHAHGRLPDPPPVRPTAGFRASQGDHINPKWIYWTKDAAETVSVVLEQIGEETLSSIHEAIRSATVVCFVGFGYAKHNLEKLDVSKTLERHPPPEVFGSAYGLDDGEQERVRQRMPGRKIELGSMEHDCLKVLRRFDVCRD